MKKILYLVLVTLLAAAVPARGQNNQTYTLGKIPAGWTVKANGNTVTVTDSTAIIPAGATVVLTPTNTAKVKKVTLVNEGLLNGQFSVSSTKKVQFSQGNLQWSGNNGWRFAENQWTYIGNNANNTSPTASDDNYMDLFCWGATGLNGIAPNTSTTYLTGSDELSGNNDWGANVITNGANKANYGWRTLSGDEWNYLLTTRTTGGTVGATSQARYTMATINTDGTGINGTILFPDGVNFAASEFTTLGNVNSHSKYTTKCTSAQWTALAAKGCVFLPAAGCRAPNYLYPNETGIYCSSSPDPSNGSKAYYVHFYGNNNTSDLMPQVSDNRNKGFLVRLVKDVTASSTACRRILLDTVQHNLVAQDCDTLTGELQHNVKISIADGATVTLDGVTINGTNNESYRWAGITCLGNVTITLKDGTTNTVKGFYNEYPGVFVYDGYTLTINGGGTLIASSNGHGAGIGGGYNISCGNIDIQGGIIEATGGYHAAGIGGGHVRNCGTITITDGVTRVTATKGTDAPNSIGIGYRDNENTCGTITFGNQQMYDGSEWTTTPTNGQTYGGLKFSIKTTTITDDTWELTCRRVDLSQITADSVMQDGDVLTGTLTANVKISIADGATVTLNNVTINGTNNSNYKWAGITCLGDATIILSGTNTVKGFYENYPGIQAAAGKTLTINGTGSLTASSNGYSAGIGGGSGVACGNIEIQGGTITATGGERGAGIGGAYNASWGNITISGGTVNATGGENAAGIGGGRRFTANVSCGNILISGGTVNATGGEDAAGIGGGRGNNNNYKSSCGTVTITTDVTKVTATKGGDDAPNSIGAGRYGTCGTVTIGSATGAITDSPYTYPPQP